MTHSANPSFVVTILRKLREAPPDRKTALSPAERAQNDCPGPSSASTQPHKMTVLRISSYYAGKTADFQRNSCMK
jgi:hypothetical protein